MELEVVSFRGSKARWVILWSSLFCGLLYLQCGAQGALTPGEIGALDQLYSNFPSLAIAHRRIIVSPTGEYFGKAWTSNFTSYCDHGEGYEFNGVYCHEGHVSGINVNQQWETQRSTNYSLISGLQFLKNITNFQNKNAELLIAVVEALPVQHIDSSSPSLEDSSFAYPESVLSLEGEVSETFNISSFTNLQKLNLSMYSINATTFDAWDWPYATLESLHLRFELPAVWWLDHYHLFPALRVLKSIWRTRTDGTLVPADFESQTLQVVEIILRDSDAPIQLKINCTACLEVKLQWDTSSVNISAPFLQKLSIETIASWPGISTNLTFLKELTLRSVGRYDPPEDFPNMDFAPALISFDWSMGHSDPENWVRILCSLPSTLRSLSLMGIQLEQEKEFPSCFTTLHSVDLTEAMTSVSRYNSTTLILNLPSTLTSLRMTIALQEAIHIDTLKKFTQLQSLSLTEPQWIGELPADFLETFPELSSIHGKVSVSGTIPSRGWNSLKWFDLTAPVTTWEGIDSAPNLEHLELFSSRLTRFPSNEQFIAANLQSLVYLKISGTVPGPVPTFWSSLTKIEEVYLAQNLFTGPFDAVISSTSLILADLSGNKLCGSLPEVPVPIKPDVLRFHNNQFSGSIPNSWSTNLSYISALTFYDNPINGSIPDGLVEKGSEVKLSNTNLVGAVWNMSRYTPSQITIVNSGIDICRIDPEIPAGIQPICIFNNITACPEDCPSYWPCLYQSPCNRLTFIPQTVEQCIVPQLAPSASLQCPPPSPPGFVCINGQYIANGSVTMLAVTLPSEAGVIVVKGNFSVTGALTFSGLGSTIEVEGCVDVAPSEIHIVLSSSDAVPLTTLINQKGSDCATDLSKIPVIVEQRKGGCKRFQVSTLASTRASLVVAFTIDSSRCNVKWIILGSTLGGVLIIAVIAVVLLHVFSSSFRKFYKKRCC